MTSFEREDCGSCGSSQLMRILDLGRSPVANYFPADGDEAIASETFPLRLDRCHTCGLAQLGDVVSEDVLWRGEYGYYSSTSPALHDHFSAYAEQTVQRWRSLADVMVVDVGCNDGLLLGKFSALGCPTFGVDPAKGPTEKAREAGLNVETQAFGLDVARGIVADIGHAGVVVANNVAAHVADLDDFLKGLAYLTGDDGVLVMEVQYLPDLIAGNGFDLIYHEHRFFYTLSSLTNALSLRGLKVVDVEHVNTQGGSIRVTARSVNAYDTTHPQARIRVNDFLAREQRFHDAASYGGLQARAEYVAWRLRATLSELKRDGALIAAYGAAAKATTLIHWTGIEGYLDWAEDTTPAKVGRVMPGTRIPILEPNWPSLKPDVYLLTAHNYASYILRRQTSFFESGGQIVVPVPVPIVL